MTIAQEEIFGPVLSIIPYDDEDDAVAHRQRLALRPVRWRVGGDAERAKGVARQIRTGQIEVNGGAFNPNAPFGGYKQSGYGREYGTARLRGVPRDQVDAAVAPLAIRARAARPSGAAARRSGGSAVTRFGAWPLQGPRPRRRHRCCRPDRLLLLFRIASGSMLGPDQPVILQMLEITPALGGARRAWRWSSRTAPSRCSPAWSRPTTPTTAFGDVDVALLVGRHAPQGGHGARRPARAPTAASSSRRARRCPQRRSDDVKVLVVGNPANTNA